MQQVSQQLERILKFGLDKGKVLPMPPSLEDSIEVKKKTKDQKPKNVKKLKKSLTNNIETSPANPKHGCSASAAAITQISVSVGDIFWVKCDEYPWWPCMLIGRRLTTDKTQNPQSKIVGTAEMWCALLFGGREYAWVAKDGLLP